MSASRLRLGTFLLVLACCLLSGALVQTLALVGWAHVGWFAALMAKAALSSFSVALLTVLSVCSCFWAWIVWWFEGEL